MTEVSVIIPTYNSASTITKTISALQNQNFPKNKFDIIVVDDGSTDNTKEVVSRFRSVEFISIKHGGPAKARNAGAKIAKGKILLFTDADCVPVRNWIREMIKHLDSKTVVGSAGTYRTLNKENIIARFAGYEIEERHKNLEKQKFIDFIGTFSAGYTKNIFSKFNGFDEKFTTASGEDPELSFKINKAGYKMIYEPSAIVYHKHPDALFKFLRQKFWRGYWRVFVYKKHRDKMFKHSYTPKTLFFEEALIGIALLSIFLGAIGFIPLYFGAILLLISFLLTLPLSFIIFKQDKSVGILSPALIILRNIVTGIGITLGLIKLLFK